jgi:hypothetical protein
MLNHSIVAHAVASSARSGWISAMASNMPTPKISPSEDIFSHSCSVRPPPSRCFSINVMASRFNGRLSGLGAGPARYSNRRGGVHTPSSIRSGRRITLPV